MCYYCKKPYFAGRKECINGSKTFIEEHNNNNPKVLVCEKYTNLRSIVDVTN